ncbi:MAG: hypothetical protein IJU70_06230 [Lentisphaeria bacterium]|nr:hypothetical protein [Lentisphaeria bacterium]
MEWKTAQWIWLDGDDGAGVRHVVFRRDFRLEAPPEDAVLAVTGSASFRLKINGQWISDGPARAWPEHYSCDVMDCSHLLRRGLNRLEAEVYYPGRSLSPAVPRGGFLAALDMSFASEDPQFIGTDGSWLAGLVRRAEAPETVEFSDAAADGAELSPASVVCGAEAGPWKNIEPRSVPPLSRREALIRRVTEANLVEKGEPCGAAPCRRVRPVPPGTVENAQAMIYPDDRCAVIHPSDGYDIELVCDFGQLDTGFWNFVVHAPAGTVIDMGTGDAPLCRFVCRAGWNRFTARTRRCGRKLHLILRRMTGPVRIQSVRLVESTYPVVSCGEFSCSDEALTRAYREALQALKLCMADTFTGLPPDEETFRAIDLHRRIPGALLAFGAVDLVVRSLVFAGECLTRSPRSSGVFPPDGEEAPFAAGFMWIIALRDFLRGSADPELLRREFPRVLRIVEDSVQRIDPVCGLLRRGDAASPPVLLSDSLLFKGALDAACSLAGDAGAGPGTVSELRSLADRIACAANALWDERRLAYHDGIDAEGKPIDRCSVAAGMLALLFDAVPERWRVSAGVNTVSPREELVPDLAPHLGALWCETLEKLGMYEQLLERLRQGSSSGLPPELPLFLLPRIVLGLRMEEGGRKFVVSPFVRGLDHASGVCWTPRGPVRVSWRREGTKGLIAAISVPPGTEASFAGNVSSRDLDVQFKTILSTEM